MKRLILLSILLAIAPAGELLAQRAGVEITPVIGYRGGGTIATDVTDLFEEDVQIDDSSMYGVFVDVDLSRDFALEFLANHQSSEFEVGDDLFDPEISLADGDVTYWHVGLLWRVPMRDVEPFLSFTLGGATLDPQIDGVDAENRLSGSLGGGGKGFFSRNVGIRLDGRGYWVNLDTDNECSRCDDWDDDYWENDDDMFQGEASVGLAIAF